MTLWGSLSSSLISPLSPSTPHLASLFFISFDLLWEGGEFLFFLDYQITLYDGNHGTYALEFFQMTKALLCLSGYGVLNYKL